MSEQLEKTADGATEEAADAVPHLVEGPVHSPLHARHVALGAKFAEFGGWSMPLEYAGDAGGVMKEHAAVRTAVGIFDVSHLGNAEVAGPGAADLVNRTLSNDLAKIAPGRAQYTLCCDASGGIVDDLIVYYRDDEHVDLIPNAANTAEVVRRLREATPAGVEVLDQHHDRAILAVQGPRCDAVLDAVGLPTGHDYMTFVATPFEGAEVVVCRTGYTGERGYELVAPAAVAPALWDALMAAGEPHGIAPCGLGARDTLRTEMGYPLHGQDISLDVTPNQARLGWAVGWKKDEFWGRDALLAEKEAGPSRRLCALAAEGRAIPRAHMGVLDADGELVGEITSGTFSPTLRRGIGLALLATSVGPDDALAVDVRGRREGFVRTTLPFVDTSVRDS